MTGVFGRSVRRKTIPSVSAIAATSFAVWFASHGCRTVLEWIARIEAMSSSAICDGPSSPIETPACEPASLRFARLIADMRMKSYAREKKAANVDEKAFQPRACSPTAAASSCCSAMYISKYRSGCALAKISANVELLTSPSSATTSPRAAPRAASASPYALRVATSSPRSYRGSSSSPLGNLCGCAASGFATSTRMLRSPPSSAIAASGSSSALPCQPGWFSIALTPLPLIVRAIDRLDVVPVDLDRLPPERMRTVAVDVEIPTDHRLAPLAEPVDVDDRGQVVELV